MSCRFVISGADGSYLKELTKIQKLDVIILDDFGLEPLDAHSPTNTAFRARQARKAGGNGEGIRGTI
jgi:hypothetical protein